MITSTVHAALDIWAAAWHHAHNGAEGHPPFDEIFNEPPAPKCSGRDLTSSYETYDATDEKYTRLKRQMMDLRILASIESVERTLHKCEAPQWFREYLLAVHPRYGRFVPQRTQLASIDEEDNARAFVEGGHMASVFGGLHSKQMARAGARFVRATERQFLSRLAKELANGVTRPLAERVRAARVDSRVPVETA